MGSVTDLASLEKAVYKVKFLISVGAVGAVQEFSEFLNIKKRGWAYA